MQILRFYLVGQICTYFLAILIIKFVRVYSLYSSTCFCLIILVEFLCSFKISKPLSNRPFFFFYSSIFLCHTQKLIVDATVNATANSSTTPTREDPPLACQEDLADEVGDGVYCASNLRGGRWQGGCSHIFGVASYPQGETLRSPVKKIYRSVIIQL